MGVKVKKTHEIFLACALVWINSTFGTVPGLEQDGSKDILSAQFYFLWQALANNRARWDFDSTRASSRLWIIPRSEPGSSFIRICRWVDPVSCESLSLYSFMVSLSTWSLTDIWGVNCFRRHRLEMTVSRRHSRSRKCGAWFVFRSWRIVVLVLLWRNCQRISICDSENPIVDRVCTAVWVIWKWVGKVRMVGGIFGKQRTYR